MTGKKPIDFSIITPVYNRSDVVGRCVGSVARAMTHLKAYDVGSDISVEHVVVDDGSTDGTAGVVAELAKRYDHIRFVKMPKNGGPNAARNAAISCAIGEWCIFLDSDDYFADNALSEIVGTMHAHPGYRLYMFAPDDMQPVYQANPKIQDSLFVELTFEDFLSEKVGGDFIHVANTSILRSHPFDERLRINEDIFFLQFYRDAQKVLFANKLVTIIERNRTDSVTRQTIRTSTEIISRQLRGGLLKLRLFERDYIACNLRRQLYSLYLCILDNSILIGQYEQAKDIAAQIGSPRCTKDRILRVIMRLRLGRIYRHALKVFLRCKYDLLKHPIF